MVEVEDANVWYPVSDQPLSPGRDGDSRHMPDPDARNPDTASFEQPKELRTLQVLTHVMMNLRDLVRWACEESPLNRTTLTFPVYIACVEVFFTNARLAAEFFWKMPAGTSLPAQSSSRGARLKRALSAWSESGSWFRSTSST
jgi:hypothetical protein